MSTTFTGQMDKDVFIETLSKLEAEDIIQDFDSQLSALDVELTPEAKDMMNSVMPLIEEKAKHAAENLWQAFEAAERAKVA